MSTESLSTTSRAAGERAGVAVSAVLGAGEFAEADDDFFSDELSPMPSHFLWANCLTAWQEVSFTRYFMNTILITFGPS